MCGHLPYAGRGKSALPADSLSAVRMPRRTWPGVRMPRKSLAAEGIAGRSAEPAAPPASTAPPPPPPGTGKGRPTPKRREAETRRRTPVAAPANRKEAAKLARSQARDRRRAARAALASGDERFLPARDAGPVRRYARDFVDSRRNVGGLFLPMSFLVLILSTLPVPALRAAGSLLLLAMSVVLFADSVYVARAIRRRTATKFPGPSGRGVGLYAAMRAMQIRRLRLPPPRVSRGQKV